MPKPILRRKMFGTTAAESALEQAAKQGSGITQASAISQAVAQNPGAVAVGGGILTIGAVAVIILAIAIFIFYIRKKGKQA